MKTVEFIFRYPNGIEAGRFKHSVDALPAVGSRVSFGDNRATTINEYWDHDQEFEVNRVLQVVQFTGECCYVIVVVPVED